MDYEMEKKAYEHTGLVKSVARKLSYVYDEDLEDLIQIGYIGLIKAIKGFDPQKGYKFSTYAVPLIAGEIRSQLRDYGAIKVSRSIKADINIIKRAEADFMALNNKSPKVSELAKLTELSEERIMQALQAQDVMKNIANYEDVNVLIREEETTIERLDLKNTLEKLNETERQIMVLRYYKDMTQSQVAKVVGLSQVQVSRIEQKTLKNMAKFMVSEQKNMSLL